jgi:hypothetical protein
MCRPCPASPARLLPGKITHAWTPVRSEWKAVWKPGAIIWAQGAHAQVSMGGYSPQIVDEKKIADTDIALIHKAYPLAVSVSRQAVAYPENQCAGAGLVLW